MARGLAASRYADSVDADTEKIKQPPGNERRHEAKNEDIDYEALMAMADLGNARRYEIANDDLKQKATPQPTLSSYHRLELAREIHVVGTEANALAQVNAEKLNAWNNFGTSEGEDGDVADASAGQSHRMNAIHNRRLEPSRRDRLPQGNGDARGRIGGDYLSSHPAVNAGRSHRLQPRLTVQATAAILYRDDLPELAERELPFLRDVYRRSGIDDALRHALDSHKTPQEQGSAIGGSGSLKRRYVSDSVGNQANIGFESQRTAARPSGRLQPSKSSSYMNPSNINSKWSSPVVGNSRQGHDLMQSVYVSAQSSTKANPHSETQAQDVASSSVDNSPLSCAAHRPEISKTSGVSQETVAEVAAKYTSPMLPVALPNASDSITGIQSHEAAKVSICPMQDSTYLLSAAPQSRRGISRDLDLLNDNFRQLSVSQQTPDRAVSPPPPANSVSFSNVHIMAVTSPEKRISSEASRMSIDDGPLLTDDTIPEAIIEKAPVLGFAPVQCTQINHVHQLGPIHDSASDSSHTCTTHNFNAPTTESHTLASREEKRVATKFAEDDIGRFAVRPGTAEAAYAQAVSGDSEIFFKWRNKIEHPTAKGSKKWAAS